MSSSQASYIYIYIKMYIQKHVILIFPGLVSTHLTLQVQEKRLVLIERGEAELWLPEADGERFVGLSGPTKVRFGWGSLGVRWDVFFQWCLWIFFWGGERFFEKDMWYVIFSIYHVVFGFRWVRFGNFGRLFLWVERQWIEIVGETLFLFIVWVLKIFKPPWHMPQCLIRRWSHSQNSYRGEPVTIYISTSLQICICKKHTYWLYHFVSIKPRWFSVPPTPTCLQVALFGSGPWWSLCSWFCIEVGDCPMKSWQLFHVGKKMENLEGTLR